MKVKELIEMLKLMPQEREVWIQRENSAFKQEYDATTIESVAEDYIDDKVNNETKRVVVINAE